MIDPPDDERLIEIAAHDLRNLLAPMRNITRILRREGASLPSIGRLDTIDDLVRMISQLIDNTVTAHAVLRDSVRLEPARSDLRRIIDSAIVRLRPVIDRKGQSLSVSVNPDPFVLTADPMRLSQVCFILLDNAARFSPENGAIGIAATVDGTWAEIRVLDDGPGIPAEIQDDLFRMFAGRSQAEHGLGVGLAVARAIVQLHGGTIRGGRPASGSGTEIVVRLPLSTAAAPQAP